MGNLRQEGRLNGEADESAVTSVLIISQRPKGGAQMSQNIFVDVKKCERR